MTEKGLQDHVKAIKEKNIRKNIEHIANFVGKGSVLEVGSAIGSFLKVAVDEGFDATGVDLSQEACELARKEVPDAKIYQGTLESIGIEPESFDLIFMSDLVEHIPNPALFWEEIFRLLKFNGMISIITPDPRHWSCKMTGSSWVHFKDEHLVFYPKNTVKWVCRKFGLHFIESSYICLLYTSPSPRD